MQSWPSIYIPPFEGEVPELKLRVTEGKLSAEKIFKIFVCGITPYDATHLGHALTYIYFDLISRYQLLDKKKLVFIENVTDVDDPLFERAKKDGRNWQELAQSQITLFQRDMTALRVIPPRSLDLVSETIDLVLKGVESLQQKGLLYEIDGDYYFDISDSLSDLPLSYINALKIFSERGGDPQRAGKREKLDPLVWKRKRAGEPSWNSKFGPGRPGWHIECAVIAERGVHNDSTNDSILNLQGGGEDLIFPHHFMTKVIAEKIFDKKFSEAYDHCALLGLDGEKMSKSRGNLVFVNELLNSGWDAMEIRYALINRDFKKESMWTPDELLQARAAISVIREALSRENCADPKSLIEKMLIALSDDMDTLSALGHLAHWAQTTIAEGGQFNSGAVSRFIDSALGLAL